MRIAIMQPYFFPYIGYWQLMNAVDLFVVYDDGKFIKNGWIHRNRILGQNGCQPYQITLDVEHPSCNRAINEHKRAINPVKVNKLLKTIENTYFKAPYYGEVMDLIRPVITDEEEDLVKYLTNELMAIRDYLGIDTRIRLSSEVNKDGLDEVGSKVFRICHYFGIADYVNPIGGMAFYDKKDWKERGGVNLQFLQRDPSIVYDQFNEPFIPDLSIIDVLMFNGREGTKQLLNRFSLV